MQYIDALRLRLGALQRFCQIEEQSQEWWFPTLDRGAGASLHFAADHGQVKEVATLMTLLHGCDACRERCKHGHSAQRPSQACDRRSGPEITRAD